jgi:hypothetical protein
VIVLTSPPVDVGGHPLGVRMPQNTYRLQLSWHCLDGRAVKAFPYTATCESPIGWVVLWPNLDTELSPRADRRNRQPHPHSNRGASGEPVF